MIKLSLFFIIGLFLFQSIKFKVNDQKVKLCLTLVQLSLLATLFISAYIVYNQPILFAAK